MRQVQRFFVFCLLCCGLLFCNRAQATPLTFNFTLSSGYTTSAGAYKPDGTLVKTLWRKVYYTAGTHSFTWDGTDDSGAAAAGGTYQFKVIAHNMQYVWDGAAANTSASQTGFNVHKAFYPMMDMAIGGSNAFYCTGYNEGGYDFARFDTSTPQVVSNKWTWYYNASRNIVESIPATIYDRDWKYTATDGTWVYYASADSTHPTTRDNNTYKGFVTASKVSDSSLASFTNGVRIDEGPSNFPPYANGIYAGTQPGLSGLAVQTTGDLLATAVAPDNKVYFFDKRSGAASGSLTVTAPKRIEFAPNGDLWVISGTTVARYILTSSTGVWTVATTIAGFSNPLDVAVHPSNNNIVMVADGGTSQQVKAYNSTGTSLWTYGTAGGYITNGATVANNKFWFHNDYIEDTFIAIQSDGSFWVGDPANRRNLHFSSARAYLDQIAFLPHSYSISVDATTPTRVFNEYLEYAIDYSQPVGSGWTLVKNWGAGRAAQDVFGFTAGIRQVTKLSNGRTYGTAYSGTLNQIMLVELVGNNLREIGAFDQAIGYQTTISSNGDLIKNQHSVATWTKRALTGFDGSNNPQWSADVAYASASSGSTDPAPRCCGGISQLTPKTSTNVLVSYDQSLNNGYHLGGVNVGGTSWLWRAMPAVSTNIPLDGLGSYDIGDGVTYGGNLAMTNGRNILAGYNGEFYNGGQAAQFMHFYDNGLFVGQFGESSIGHTALEGFVAGYAGNGFTPSLVKVGNELYLWVNDESGHSLQRWHLVNANNIREFSESGTLGGSSVNLTAAATAFPSDVTATAGNTQIGLTWAAVAGATSYNVKYSTSDGGPYTSITGVTGTSYGKTGLTNGTKYYFVVSAIVGGVESVNSQQVTARPLDTTVVVQTAGQQSTIQTLYPVKSTAPAAGQPALTGLSTLTGDLTINDVGNKGYKIFNWGGAGTDNSNVLSPFSVTKGGSWYNNNWIAENFKVDGVDSSNYALYSNPSGYIDINVSDTDFHILTVFCPAFFADPRNFTLKLTPQGASTPAASYVVNEAPGRNHTYQFRFKGNVRLSMDVPTDWRDAGVIHAIFLDNMQVYSPPATPAVTAVGHYTAPASTSVTYSVSSSAPSGGLPALTGLSGLLLNSVGTKGYQVYNWGGSGTTNSNVLSPFTVGTPSGFFNESWLADSFTIGGVAGSNWGLFSNPTGTINVNVSDTNTHTLTVFSTAYFADTRTFTIKVTPQGQTTPVASYTVTGENPGKSHIFQFQFTGNVTLSVVTPTNWQQVGVVQAIFLD